MLFNLVLANALKMLQRIINHITTERRASAEHYCVPESRCHVLGPLVMLILRQHSYKEGIPNKHRKRAVNAG